MNMQEAYEQMRAWLTRPGAKQASAHEGATCMYDAGNGQRCAVGCLLSEQAILVFGGLGGDAEELVGTMLSSQEFTDEPLLGLFSEDFIAHFKEYGTVVSSDDAMQFLMAAQDCHDRSLNWTSEGFNVAHLDCVASDFGLKVVSA